MIMVNEKFRGNVKPWGIKCYFVLLDCADRIISYLDSFSKKPEHFSGFFQRVLELSIQATEKLTMIERSICVVFLINAYQSLENELVRRECLRFVFSSSSFLTNIKPIDTYISVVGLLPPLWQIENSHLCTQIDPFP